MAARKRKKDRKPVFDDLSPQTKQAIGAVGFFLLAVMFSLSLAGYAGVAGDWTDMILGALFGGGAYLAPIVCLFYVYALMNPREEDQEVSRSKVIGIALVFLAILGSLGLYQATLGGYIGGFIASPLNYLIGSLASSFVLGAVFLVGIFLTFNTGFTWPSLFKKTPSEEGEELEDELSELELPLEDEQEVEEEDEAIEEEPKAASPKLGFGSKKDSPYTVSSFSGPYTPPPLSLLLKDRGKAKTGDVKANANIIKRTLKNFNIEVEMDEVSIGPSVTRYA